MVYVIKYIDIISAKQHINLKLAKNKINQEEILTINYDKDIDLTSQLKQDSLFNSYKAYIINDAFFLSDLKEFERCKDEIMLINEMGKQYDIFLLLKGDRLLSNKDFKLLTKDFDITIMKEMDENNKQKIINDLLQKNNLNLSKNVYNQLVSNLDCNYGNIINEIQKLSLISKTKHSEQDLLDIICNYNSKKIFDLLEAILFKQHDKAWTIYKDLMDHYVDEIAIINTISSQLLNIYYSLLLSNQNVPITKISEKLGISVYFINLYKKHFINYNISKLLDLINSLYRLEIEIKLSLIDKKIGLKQFLLNV